MSDYCPGAVQVPQPGGVVLDTSLPPRFVWHITWDQLHPDGSQPDLGAVANYLQSKQYCPHIMWNPFTGYMEQYYPASVGSRALAFNDQDGSACIQIEVFFTPGCVVDGITYQTVADTPLVGFNTLLEWADSLGVPRTWPMGAPQWQGNSRDAGIWNAQAGHYGHCNSPGDTHTDPGPMPSLTTTQQGFLMALTSEQQDQLFADVQNIKGYLFAGGPSVAAGEGDPSSVFGRLITTQAQSRDSQLALTSALPRLLTVKPAAAGPASVDVDALVTRLKTELPAAIRADLKAKL